MIALEPFMSWTLDGHVMEPRKLFDCHLKTLDGRLMHTRWTDEPSTLMDPWTLELNKWTLELESER